MPARFAESLQWIDQQQGHMAELLRQWASINSGSHHLSGLECQAAAIREAFKNLGGEMKALPLPPYQIISDNGRAETKTLGAALSLRSPPRDGPRVLLAIHYDTVFGAKDPFQAVTQVDGMTMRGPGVCDAKGGLVVLLYALRALERSPLAWRLNWEVILNPDEELGSPGSGTLFHDAARRNDLGLLFEPALADGNLVSSRKGSGNFTFVVHGKSAHAGRNSEQGRNAINALAALINQLAALAHDIPGIIVNTGFIHGGGPVNIVPDLAMARVNVRVDNATQQHAVETRLQALAGDPHPDGIRVELHGSFLSPPKPMTPALDALLHHIADCGRQLRFPLSWCPTGGACDGNRLAAAGLPAVDSLGVRGGSIHTDQEFMQLHSLAERAKLTALFLMRLAAGEIALDSITRNSLEVAHT